MGSNPTEGAKYLFECFFDGLKMSGGYLLYSAPNLLNTYIKPATKQEQNKIVSEVRKIINASNNNETELFNELEQSINQLVYQLYDLTAEEIEIIENSVK